MENKGINFDPYDLDGMRKLMDEHGDSVSLFGGMNENMEQVSISIAKERIDVVTYQHNGWTRVSSDHAGSSARRRWPPSTGRGNPAPGRSTEPNTRPRG